MCIYINKIQLYLRSARPISCLWKAVCVCFENHKLWVGGGDAMNVVCHLQGILAVSSAAAQSSDCRIPPLPKKGGKKAISHP